MQVCILHTQYGAFLVNLFAALCFCRDRRPGHNGEIRSLVGISRDRVAAVRSKERHFSYTSKEGDSMIHRNDRHVDSSAKQSVAWELSYPTDGSAAGSANRRRRLSGILLPA